MSLLLRQIWPAVTLVLLLVASALINGAEDKPVFGAAGEADRDTLAQFDKHWRDYTNDPNFGDPRWKLKMETLVRLAKAGAAAVPLLEEAAKEDSAWAPHTRNQATEMLAILRGPQEVREALASYDLTQMDTAQIGKPAPDFVLTDAAGQTCRLSQLRKTKTVVLTFILQDI